MRLEFLVPARGLIGFRTELLTETRGTALLHHVFERWEPWAGELKGRRNGSLVADRRGPTTAHALTALQERGQLFVGPGVEVYEGMVVGENARVDDMDVNPTKEKKLNNIRSSTAEIVEKLIPPRLLSLEQALEEAAEDECVEVTPLSRCASARSSSTRRSAAAWRSGPRPAPRPPRFGGMRFSIWPSLTQPWSDVVDVAQHAEATGWDGVYVADHFMGDAGAPWPVEIPTLEATAALAALAAVTTRVRLAPLVLGITYRHPAVLAKWAATVDHVSGGRLHCSASAPGGRRTSTSSTASRSGSPGERIARFEEALRRAAGAAAASRRRRSRASTTDVRDAIAEPKPVQAPLPILVGGKGDRMLRRRRPPRRRVEHVVDAGADRRALGACSTPPARRRVATRRRSSAVDAGAVLPRRRRRQGRRPGGPGGAPAGRRPARRSASPSTVAAWRDAGVDELIVPDFTLGNGTRRDRRHGHPHRAGGAGVPLIQSLA